MIEIIKDLPKDWFGRFVLFIAAASVLLLPYCFYLTIEDQKTWNEFKTDHHCRVVGKMSGSISTGVGFAPTSNGVSVIPVIEFEEDKIGYLCDDGVTYWR